jgi:cation:H+ antiporter
VEYFQLIIGLVALILGGELLVRASVGFALRAHIAPLVIGMTIVSFGTSAPELLVSISAALEGHPDVSTGAVIGSNISNLALVLGITVLIYPIHIKRDSLTIDWPVMMLASILLYCFSSNLLLEAWEGVLFLVILVSFSAWLITRSRKKGIALSVVEEVGEMKKPRPIVKDVLFFVLGIAGLYGGSEWLIDAVVSIAHSKGVSEKLVSVTIVAFGTSLPELVTSVVAAFRKETDISIGNLIGSNIFNILAILGITAIVKPIKVSPSLLQFDAYFMLGVAALLLPFMMHERKVGRIKGGILVLIYILYVYWVLVREI